MFHVSVKGELSPELELWLAVTVLAIRDLKNNEHTYTAFQWLSDPGNIVFEMLSESLGYESSALRKMIFDNLQN